MLRSGARAIPVLALAVGSWVGLHAPAGADPGPGAPRRSWLSLAPTLPSGTPERARLQPEAPGVPVEASLLPDPTPWPDLNPSGTISRAWLLAEGPAATATSGRRVVTFTFDDGPFPETTPVVLRVLEKHGVRGTFFWIGRYLDGDGERAVASRETARRVRDAGHLIGNHTHDHARLPVLPAAQELAQIVEGSASIERATGIRPCLFRPPYGQLDAYSEAVVRDRGLTLVLWNIEVEDLKKDDADAMAESLEEQIEFSGGGIVLLHDIRFSTAEALDRVLTWLDERRYDPARPGRTGYAVVDFVDFMRETAASPQPYPNRSALEDARAAAWRKQHTRATLPRRGEVGSEGALTPAPSS